MAPLVTTAVPSSSIAKDAPTNQNLNVNKDKQPVSKPASLAQTPPEGVKQLPLMLKSLDSKFPAESEEGLAKRKRVLAGLSEIVKDWAREVGVTHIGMDDETAKKASAKIFLFGSSTLGVLTAKSDIDCVCVVPKHITRDHFFQMLATKLEEISLSGDKTASLGMDIKEVNPIPEGHSPIICMDIDGVPVDLGFAQLQLPTLRNLHSLENDNLLIGLDEKSARGVGGNRVNEMVLSLVPNKEAFRHALRFIKSWSKARGIASNMLGYFGGITYAILTARICQLYPNFNGAMLVSRFFKVYRQWSWGHKQPVLLCPITVPKEPKLGGLKVWDPRSHIQDKAHLMPIITPAFPAMNSTHNVSQSTKETLISEFRRGHNITLQIFNGTKTWADLYQRPPFFTQHHHYLRLVLCAKTSAMYNTWEGFCQSKLRRIIQLLEQHCPGIHVRPWAEAFNCRPSSVDGNMIDETSAQNEDEDEGLDDLALQQKYIYPHTKQMFIGLNFRSPPFIPQQTCDLRSPMEKFIEFLVNIWKNEGKDVEAVNILLHHCAPDDLPDDIKDIAELNGSKETDEGEAPSVEMNKENINGPSSDNMLSSGNIVNGNDKDGIIGTDPNGTTVTDPSVNSVNPDVNDIDEVDGAGKRENQDLDEIANKPTKKAKKEIIVEGENIEGK